MTRRCLVRKFLTVVSIAGICNWLSTATAHDWPQYLGPDRNSTSPEKGLLRSWPQSGPEVLWTVTLAEVMADRWSKTARCTCSTGMMRSATNFAASISPMAKNSGTYAYDAPGSVMFPGSRSVPTVDGGHVYTCGHNGDLHCIDINTHKPVWKANVWTDFGGKPPSRRGRISTWAK